MTVSELLSRAAQDTPAGDKVSPAPPSHTARPSAGQRGIKG